MIKNIAIFALISTFVVVDSIPIENEYYGTKPVNEYVDKVLSEVVSKFNEILEPYPMADREVRLGPIKTTINKKKVEVFGDAKQTNGFVTGLSHMSRFGDCVLDVKNNRFVAVLKFGNNSDIKVQYNTDLMVPLEEVFRWNITLEEQLNDIFVNVTIGLNEENNPDINDVTYEPLSRVKFHILGPFGHFDSLIEGLGERPLLQLDPSVNDMLTPILHNFVTKSLNSFKFPEIKE